MHTGCGLASSFTWILRLVLDARVEMLMKEISTEITETSKYVVQRVEPQDIIVPWDRPNLNLENDEYLADKKAPTREADVVLLFTGCRIPGCPRLTVAPSVAVHAECKFADRRLFVN